MIAIRPATEDDLPAILAIYNDAVLNTSSIWNDTPADLANRRAWFDARKAQSYPILVAEIKGALAGYASYGDFRPFEGYRFSVEHSVYVTQDARRCGVATKLLQALIEHARAHGKHVNPKIMAAKVKALLARARPSAVVHRPIELGPLCIDAAAREVTVDGQLVELTRRELDVLLALAEHPGWVYTRDQLLSNVWGYDAVVETRLVDMQVANLRRKLGDAAALVETVRGVGYRLRPPA